MSPEVRDAPLRRGPNRNETWMSRARREPPPFPHAWIGPGLLLCALALNAIFLFSELGFGQPAWNDTTFHIVAAERLEQSVAAGEPFLDPWVSEWALGYPVWRTYQPLPHVLAAVIFRITEAFALHPQSFAAWQYLLLVCLPLSVYAGAHWLGLGPVGCGLAALLTFAPSGSGDFVQYGIGYGAFVRNGTGLYTQLVAFHFLVLSIGAVARALDSGRMRTTASFLLAATTLSHLVFGYVAFVSVAVLALVGRRGERGRRMVRLTMVAAPALLLVLWLVVPMILGSGEVNHSRWEPPYKWDSFGAAMILRALSSGVLLDSGRLPTLTILLAAAAILAAVSAEALPRRLLALAVLWLALFFGRATWGRLLLLAGVPGDFHLHRLQGAFELTATILAAWGGDRMLRAAAARSRNALVVAATILGLAFVPIAIERYAYLDRNARDARSGLIGLETETLNLDRALDTVREILAKRPGRVAAGKRTAWADKLRVGDLPVYVFLSFAHMDEVSFLYHAMSLTSDPMAVRNEADAVHDAVFGVRALIAPAELRPEPHWRLRGVYGRLAVYECSPEGYFSLVDLGARYAGPTRAVFAPSAAWLQSSWPRRGVVLGLDDRAADVPSLAEVNALPEPPAARLNERGQVMTEVKEGETYRAHIRALRDCYALVKLTWHPDLVATLDGRPALLLRVTPGFGAVALPAGDHWVEVRYAPGPLKPILFVVGIVLFVVVSVSLRSAWDRAARA